ncbi:MAG: hypothetical protein LUE96_02860 [Lachnospiraceae bacterium]|nr:hypothetical protein [Lachnospiraceae bacterium]
MEYEEYRKRSDKGVRRVEPKKEGQTGYRPSQKEKENDMAPKEVAAVKTGDGVLSFGINRKKEVTMTMSVDNEEALREDRNQVDADRAVAFPNTRGQMLTNSHDATRSAIAVKVPLGKQAYGLERKLWDAAERLSGSMVVEEVIPFITKRCEQMPGSPAYLHRQQEQQRVRQEMETGLEKLKRQAKKAEDYHRSLYARSSFSVEEAEENAPDGEEDRNKISENAD